MITCLNSSSGITSFSGNKSSSSNNVSLSKTINNPSVRSSTAKDTKIKRVILARDYTAVEINSTIGNGLFYQWCSINRNTHIIVNGTHYTMTKAKGIAIAPDVTYFYAGQKDITFTLYFPPITESATSMDLIESADSEWMFYGIKLR